VIEIDYRTLTYIVIGLFALLGFTRGWLREAFATILLMALVYMLAQPESAKRIIAIIGKLVTTFLAAFTKKAATGSPIDSLARAISGLFNVENPYGFMVLLTIFLIFVSYAVGKRSLLDEGKLVPLSRLLGGTIGAVNGFIVLSLIREYLLAILGISSDLTRSGQTLRALEAPRQVSVSLKNMPATSLVSGTTALLLFLFGFVVFAFFAREMGSRRGRAAKK
jgi:hypothetical protein